MGAPMRINILGETEVVRDRGTLRLRDFGGVKTRRILEILVLHRGQSVAKDQLAELLWEGRPPADHIATLESYVSVLRSRLEPGVGRGKSVIVTGNGAYALDCSRVSVDLDEFDELLHASTGQPVREARRSLLAALDLARGPVLSHEPYVGWATGTRDFYASRVVEATLKAAELDLELSDHAHAAGLAERATRLDPLSEGACQLAMRAHWSSGRTTDALRCYEGFRRALRTELGIDPTETTRSLFAAILATDAPTPSTGLDAAPELSALVEAVVELYQRSRTAVGTATSRAGSLVLADAAGPREQTVRVGDSAERLLRDLLSHARIGARELATAG